MKVGTPGFNGKKLREGREARGITAADLAAECGVSKQLFSDYEYGRKTPPDERFQVICSRLDLPDRYFLDWNELPGSAHTSCLFYRSLSRSTISLRTRLAHRYRWFRRVYLYFREFTEFPALNIPQFDIPQDPENLSNETIESVAEELRQSWKLGQRPIGNMVHLLESHGVLICKEDFGTDDIDAFSQIDPEQKQAFIMLNSHKAVSARSRYDLAHELGHLVLHFSIKDATSLHHLLEKQAHRFAGAFLLPRSAFGNYFIPRLDNFRPVKLNWRTSIAAAIRRAADLTIISEIQEKYLWIAYARRKWKMGEPHDDAIPFEVPSLTQNAFARVLHIPGHSIEDLLLSVPLSSRDLESLIGLSAGVLQQGYDSEKAENLTFFKKKKE